MCTCKIVNFLQFHYDCLCGCNFKKDVGEKLLLLLLQFIIWQFINNSSCGWLWEPKIYLFVEILRILAFFAATNWKYLQIDNLKPYWIWMIINNTYSISDWSGMLHAIKYLWMNSQVCLLMAELIAIEILS